MKLKITYRIDKVKIIHDEVIDRSRLASVLGESKQIVGYWFKTGRFPADIIEKLREIKVSQVQKIYRKRRA